MKEKIMRWNYKKAFITIVVLAVVLALVSVIAVPLSLSQQIRDAHAWEQISRSTPANGNTAIGRKILRRCRLVTSCCSEV